MNSKQLEEKYRNQYETDREWKLKEQFIEAYKDDYDEDRLVCLAQCYANIETMGCRWVDSFVVAGIISNHKVRIPSNFSSMQIVEEWIEFENFNVM